MSTYQEALMKHLDRIMGVAMPKLGEGMTQQKPSAEERLEAAITLIIRILEATNPHCPACRHIAEMVHEKISKETK